MQCFGGRVGVVGGHFALYRDICGREEKIEIETVFISLILFQG